MKKSILAAAIAIQLLSCHPKKTEEPIPAKNVEIEQKATEHPLIYSGTLPCADCEGIETVLTLYEGDGTMEGYKFELSSIYKGKEPRKQFIEKGNFNFERGLEEDIDGTIYVLNYDKPQESQLYYGVYSDNPEKIYLLDKQRKIINSEMNYFLLLKK